MLRDFDFFTKLFSDDVQVYFQQYFEKKGPGDIIENCEEVGFIQLIKVEIKKVNDIDYDYDNGTIIIIGKIIVRCEIEVYEYNSNYDKANDKYILAGIYNPIYEASFSFVIDTDTKKIDNFTIDSIIG